MEFRKLYADEIDVRISTINEKGASLLLYKDARVDQNVLDESFGIFGWQRKHELIGDRLYCTVSVKNPDTGEWISKQDVGTEPYTEKEKGQASDAFKRACFNLGIGRELYTAPFIWIGAESFTIKTGNNGKPATYDRFNVQSIGYEGNRISHLKIVNASRKGAVVFEFGSEKNNEKISAEVITGLKMACEKRGAPESYLCEKFKVSDLSEITVEAYNNCRAKIVPLLDRWADENNGKVG